MNKDEIPLIDDNELAFIEYYKLADKCNSIDSELQENICRFWFMQGIIYQAKRIILICN